MHLQADDVIMSGCGVWGHKLWLDDKPTQPPIQEINGVWCFTLAASWFTGNPPCFCASVDISYSYQLLKLLHHLRSYN